MKRTILRITRERERQGLSRAALGRRAGLDGARIGQIELGRFRPPSGSVTLSKIAEALGLPVRLAGSLLEIVDE
ncbi:MAG: helix-turn-helix transcriptional regulator [Deltaproteobacteria bacterium]|nr:helix-turn-helix transcriptional regulator [Deltaproteobacteria bacterium]